MHAGLYVSYYQNQFDCIDLSDNEIGKLEGFPRLPRVKTLLLNNNRIARIGEDLGGLPLGVSDEWRVFVVNGKVL
eukprot:1177767-Prorocentrum_minimum.AAC.3